jgi:hypothetical protein
MTTTDWIIDLALILIVLRQIKEHRLDRAFVIVPLALVGYTASHYLHSIPTAGNDLLLVGILGGVGAALGLVSGLATRVRTVDGVALVRAGFWAATLWVLGVGTRLAFQLYATHGGGGSVARFSAHHDITGSDVWTSALVIMALAEVVVRLAVIVGRGTVGVRRSRAATAGGVPVRELQPSPDRVRPAPPVTA